MGLCLLGFFLISVLWVSYNWHGQFSVFPPWGINRISCQYCFHFAVQLLGRWKSNTYVRYVDITDSTFVNPFHRVMRSEVEE